jgi:hypothetical protein
VSDYEKSSEENEEDRRLWELRESIRAEIGDGHPAQQEAERRSLLGHAMLNPSLHNRADVLRIVLLGTELLDLMEVTKTDDN